MVETGWRTQHIRRRNLLIGAVAAASGALLLSCNGSPTSLTTGLVQRKAVLALIEGVQNDPFYITMQKVAQAKADALGVTLLVAAPARFDANLQIPLVNAMIAQKVDVLIIAACDKVALIEPLKRAFDTGIKIISVKQGTIKVASFDAPEQAIVDLRNGAIDLVIAQKPADIGNIAVDYAVKALQGETSSLRKRVVTGYVVIDNTNVDTPEAQEAIYKNS